MAFDEADYRKRVLTPYARTKLGVVQAALRELDQNPQLTVPSGLDLAEFYDIPVVGSDAEIQAHVTAVGYAISKAEQMPNFRGVGKNLLGLHERIVARNPDLAARAFWDRILRDRARRAEEGLAEFGRSAAVELSALGVVTPTRLRELARASGVPDGVGDAKLAEVVKSGGVTVVPEFPAVSAPARLLSEIAAELRKTSCRSVLSAIFVKEGEPAQFSVLDGFRTPSGVPRLSLATVEAAYDHVARLPDTDENSAIGKVLGAIRGAVTSEHDLTALVVACFVEIGKQVAKESPLQPMARKAFVERTGIDATDAARILFEVGGKGGAPQRGWPDVQALVAQGTLKDARRLYEALVAEASGSTSNEQEKALRALEGAEHRVAALRAEAEQAVQRGDLAAARAALDQALTVCTDDESLAEIATQLPPAAPLKLVATASEDGRVVRLTWEPGFGSTAGVRYQVIRKVGSVPRNNQDGSSLASSLDATSYEDTNPPVAVDVCYGVAATRGRGFSPVSVAQVVVVPPVRDVRVSSDPSSVTLGWTTPPDARAVEVVQTAPDGTSTPLPVGAHSGATSHGLRLGATYTYLVTALYVGASGEALRSATVRVTGVPRGEAKAVASFRLVQRSGSADEVEASWPAVEGYAVEVWHFGQRPSWRFGSRVPMSDVRAHGQRLAGRSTGEGSAHPGVRGAAAQGLRYYAALTRDGDEALVGQVQPFGTCPPVADVRAERFGDEVVLSWDWPGPEYEVRVRWSGADGSGERTISQSDYHSHGGCRVRVGAAGGTFALATVAGDDGSRWLSPETTVRVQGSSASLSYDVDLHKRLFGPPTSATLTFAGSGDMAAVDVVVVGRVGKVMPYDASDGTVLGRATVTPGSRLDVALPRGKGPVWVRAFSATGGVRLVDPAPSRMKGE